MPTGLPPSLASRIAKSGHPAGCWPWTGRRTKNGYGRAYAPVRRSVAAHRAVYERLVGPIAPGLTLDHLCRNRICVNPAHLEPVTMRENLLRGVGVAAVNAAKTHCVHGHPYTEENTMHPGSKPWQRKCRACNRARLAGRKRRH